jgi:hypothetical protein
MTEHADASKFDTPGAFIAHWWVLKLTALKLDSGVRGKTASMDKCLDALEGVSRPTIDELADFKEVLAREVNDTLQDSSVITLKVDYFQPDNDSLLCVAAKSLRRSLVWPSKTFTQVQPDHVIGCHGSSDRPKVLWCRNGMDEEDMEKHNCHAIAS